MSKAGGDGQVVSTCVLQHRSDVATLQPCTHYAGAKRQRSGPCAPNGRKGSAAAGQQPEADAEDSQVGRGLGRPSAPAMLRSQPCMTTRGYAVRGLSSFDGCAYLQTCMMYTRLHHNSCPVHLSPLSVSLRCIFAGQGLGPLGRHPTGGFIQCCPLRRLVPSGHFPIPFLLPAAQGEEPLGRHPDGGLITELPEPLNVSRPQQRGVGAEDYAPPETLKARHSTP
jgi:hypothetical protein